jgi:hypothetical protein
MWAQEKRFWEALPGRLIPMLEAAFAHQEVTVSALGTRPGRRRWSSS